MQSPFSNPYLSARAKGIFAYYAELGRPVSADELSSVMPEGRDAIQSAINELRRLNYIRTTREWNGKKWISVMKFTEEVKKSKVLNTGFSGLLYDYSDMTSNTSDLATSDLSILELLRSSNILGKNFPSTEGEEMPWNLDGEETPKKRRPQIEDDSSGAVGKVEDKKAMRRAKYGAVPTSVTHRTHRSEDTWDSKDLVSEFAALLSGSSAGHLTMQLNARSLALWINQQVGRGATRPQVLAAMRMFFEDPRNLNNAGTGVPIWRRFIAYYQTVEGKVLEEKPVYMDEQALAHQEKMLKLLGGN